MQLWFYNICLREYIFSRWAVTDSSSLLTFLYSCEMYYVYVRVYACSCACMCAHVHTWVHLRRCQVSVAHSTLFHRQGLLLNLELMVLGWDWWLIDSRESPICPLNARSLGMSGITPDFYMVFILAQQVLLITEPFFLTILNFFHLLRVCAHVPCCMCGQKRACGSKFSPLTM